MKFKTLKQTVAFKTSPHELYEILLDSKKHSKFTSYKAKISRKVGGKFSACKGWITGKNLELVKDKKIVQLWKGNHKDWPKDHYSRVSFVFKKVKNGTKLILTHSKLPKGWYSSCKKGWNNIYWKRMKKLLK
ncbi:SRPBCC domain-containing protein [Candidatus Woesearchaeota archaeon]|nr:SRPBCC domain-containing protein [Candidatus Woesearchaeota archaeon]